MFRLRRDPVQEGRSLGDVLELRQQKSPSIRIENMFLEDYVGMEDGCGLRLRQLFERCVCDGVEQ